MARLLNEVRGSGPTRPLGLAAGEGAYLYLLGDLIRDILTSPGPSLKLINCDRTGMLAAVRTGRADLGVSVLDTLPDDLHTTLLASYPPTVILPADHPLAARPVLDLTDLAGTTLVPHPHPARTAPPSNGRYAPPTSSGRWPSRPKDGR